MKYNLAEGCEFMKQPAKDVVFEDVGEFMETILGGFSGRPGNYLKSSFGWDVQEARWALEGAIENCIENWLGAVK